MTRLLRRIRCALGMHRWATLYGDRYADARDGRGQYRRGVWCLFCGREGS